MKKNRTFAIVSGVLGLALAAAIVYGAFSSRQAGPRLFSVPEEAQQRAVALMEAACAGDLQTVGNMMQGQPDLGQIPEDASVAASMIWDAFVESLEYDFPGGFYASERGLAIDVHVRSLDISSVTGGVKKRVENLLNRRVEAAEDISEIYDEKNNYREDLILAVLQEATTIALKRDARYQETTIPIYLVFEQSQWWVQPSQELLNVLSGVGTGG